MGGLHELRNGTRRRFTSSHSRPTGTKHQLPVQASEIASQPVWSPDGKELFYNPGPAIRRGSASRRNRRLPSEIQWRCRDRSKPVPLPSRRAFDITPGGKFVGLIQAGQTESGTPPAPQIQVVLNWLEELKARVATQ